MASLKLLYRGEWRRMPLAPKTWAQLVVELTEMYGLARLAVTEIGRSGVPISGEQQYCELLARASSSGTKLLKIEVVEAPPGPKLIPTFHLPQCSKCLGKLTGREGLCQLACGHIFCELCFFSITESQGDSMCPYDSAQPHGAARHDLILKVQQLDQELKKISPLYFDLPPLLMQIYQDIFGQVRTEGVPCVYFEKTQSCPDKEHCLYAHEQQHDKTTSFEAVNMKDASSDSIAVESRHVATVPVSTEESGTYPNPIPTQDQFTGPDHQDSGSDAVILVDSGNATVPLEFRSASTSSHQMVSVLQETVPAKTENKQSGPGALLSEFSQSEVLPSFDSQMQFLDSLRTSIRIAVNQSRLELSDRRREEFPVTCGDCGMKPIPEHFFKCSQCETTLCPSCEEMSAHSHAMYKVKHVVQMQRVGMNQSEDSNSTTMRILKMGFKDTERVSKIVREAGGDYNRAMEMLLGSR